MRAIEPGSGTFRSIGGVDVHTMPALPAQPGPSGFGMRSQMADAK
jgi:hypothetical protein